ncbi:MAG: PEP-CTERM sorting domain-containing protein [Candidatus Omnitrophica bacterium]|nr:PEP-CTERM sorting domain-containing protein [Candidatus Omnitrophota bacterium]MDD5310977.1 PEP-CTERM sorting domain-containing protein [Candidatus Omnitrophota bacterium]
MVGSSAFATTLYDFESGTQGWTFQDYSDSMAVSAVAQSGDQAKSGSYSLAGTTHLVPGDASFSKGEVLVNRGSSNALDLQGVLASVSVYGPTGAAGTNPSSPNGWQMFFKDTSWKSWYGPWSNLTENNWTTLSSTLGSTTPDFVDSGFDPTRVMVMGVKLGTGDSSTGTYDGLIYVDQYDVIPEPASMLLLGSGLVGILGFARKKKA